VLIKCMLLNVLCCCVSQSKKITSAVLELHLFWDGWSTILYFVPKVPTTDWSAGASGTPAARVRVLGDANFRCRGVKNPSRWWARIRGFLDRVESRGSRFLLMKHGWRPIKFFFFLYDTVYDESS